jgi:hypothetical protein
VSFRIPFLIRERNVCSVQLEKYLIHLFKFIIKFLDLLLYVLQIFTIFDILPSKLVKSLQVTTFESIIFESIIFNFLLRLSPNPTTFAILDLSVFLSLDFQTDCITQDSLMDYDSMSLMCDLR